MGPRQRGPMLVTFTNTHTQNHTSPLPPSALDDLTLSWRKLIQKELVLSIIYYFCVDNNTLNENILTHINLVKCRPN